MTRRLLSIGLLAAMALPPLASAQESEGFVDPPSTPECTRDVYDAFGREQRLERAVIFGRPSAADMPVTGVLYDAQGNGWIKTADDEWKTTAEGLGDAISNDDMDGRAERDLLCDDNGDEIEASCVRFPRRGLLETKKTPTSDLIQPTVQAIRALQCRLRAVCDVAAVSPGKKQGETITVKNDGCMDLTYPVMEGCRVAEPGLYNVAPGSCDGARRELVAREMQLLTLTMSYDASYRSLAQFAGMFQEFLVQFRFPLIEPLWQTVRMLGGLKDIPCFSSECNE
jgi:hypothetical protein